METLTDEQTSWLDDIKESRTYRFSLEAFRHEREKSQLRGADLKAYLQRFADEKMNTHGTACLIELWKLFEHDTDTVISEGWTELQPLSTPRQALFVAGMTMHSWIDDNLGNATGSHYPEVEVGNTAFFDSCKYDKDRAIRLLHRIFDLTKNWDPLTRGSSLKWKILYQALLDADAFEQYGRAKFRAFVESVVCYVFPQTPVEFSGYISKAKLPDNPRKYPDEEKRLYDNLVRVLKNT